MNIEKEIRIAKLQIMWTIAVFACGIWTMIRTPVSFFWDLVLIVVLITMWYLGAISLRMNVEKESEEE